MKADVVPVETCFASYKSSYRDAIIPFIPRRLPIALNVDEIKLDAEEYHKYIHDPVLHPSSLMCSHCDHWSSRGLPHFAHFLGSLISIASAFACAFSMSWFVSRGVGGTSSIRDMPCLLFFFPGCSSITFFGNVVRRGVRAVATFFADRLILARTSQERFLAR